MKALPASIRIRFPPRMKRNPWNEMVLIFGANSFGGDGRGVYKGKTELGKPQGLFRCLSFLFPCFRFCFRQTLNWITIPRTREVNACGEKIFKPKLLSILFIHVKSFKGIGNGPLNSADPPVFGNLDYCWMKLFSMEWGRAYSRGWDILWRCRVSLRGQYKLLQGGKRELKFLVPQ